MLTWTSVIDEHVDAAPARCSEHLRIGSLLDYPALRAAMSTDLAEAAWPPFVVDFVGSAHTDPDAVTGRTGQPAPHQCVDHPTQANRRPVTRRFDRRRLLESAA